jgi:hypothetical protein
MGWLLGASLVFFGIVFVGGYLVVRRRGGTPKQLVPLYLIGLAPAMVLCVVVSRDEPTLLLAAAVMAVMAFAPILLMLRAGRLA